MTVASLRAAALCLALCGCSLVKLSGETKAFYASTVLVGRIAAPAQWSGPIVVAAYRPAGGTVEVEHQTLLHRAGGYELIVPGGEYALFAFGDVNGNGRFDAGEPAGDYLNGAAVPAPGTGVVAGLDFELRATPSARPGVPAGTLIRSVNTAHSTQAGALADLDAPAFSAQNGRHGYWAPMDYFRETGGNVYFLEPYDARKIPILFVHGAAGSAQDWRYFVERIDRSRYQPWIFQYPSGAAVDSMAYLLFWKLLNLQLDYRFETLYLTAHSMGGLVVRTFLINHAQQLPQAKLFVSLSTPWAGDASAELGVQHSPAVIPSWRDMQPEGRFMQELFARPLPPQVEHYLLFGHRGGYSMTRPNNDGTVTLASQLRSQAQAEARLVYGFDEDHVSILSSRQVLAQFQAILDNLDKQASRAPRPGRVKVEYAFDSDGDAAAALPLLALKPVGDSAQAPRDIVTLTLSGSDGGREVGPVPAGDYDASLIAAAFKTEPRSVRVHVDAGAATTASFRFKPQGTLIGYVGDDVDAVSGPAGSYRRPHPTIRIESVTLRGAGTQRILVPRRTGADNLLDAYLNGADDAYQASFAFVDLPAGEYELTIRAEGYRPHTSRHRVVPGRPEPQMPIGLERLR